MEEQKINFCDEILSVLNDFMTKLEGMQEYVFSAMSEQAKKIISYLNKLNREMKEIKKSTSSYDEKSNKFYAQLKINDDNYNNLNKKIEGTGYCSSLIVNGEIVSLVSAFDYFLYSLLRKTFLFLGENFENKDITIKYNEIKNCKSTEDIKEYYIEKYLEGIFRGSHNDLFEEIKNKFKIDDIKKNVHYKDLLFITELRNIIVHNDSKISITFKNRMDEFGISYNDYGLIDKKGFVNINPIQLTDVFEILVFYSIYIALLFALHFCKSYKEKLEEFLSEINSITLDCIKKGYEKIAIELFDYLLKISKSSSDKFIYTINKCVGLKKLKKNDEIKQTLDSLDWSNCEEKFKFAKNCLLENFDSAIEFLRKQGEKEEWKYNLQTWPLCNDLIKSEVFLQEYPKIFGEDFEKKIKVWKNTKKDINKVEKEIERKIKTQKVKELNDYKKAENESRDKEEN